MIFGHALTPIALGLLARFLIQAILNFTVNPSAVQQWKTNKAYMLFASLTVISLPIIALILGQDRIAQIILTHFVAFHGVNMLWFVMFSPDDLNREPNSFARNGSLLVGSHTTLAIGHIVLALASAALIGLGATAAWVSLMSGGSILFYMLNNWIVVLWILSQPQDTHNG